MLISYLISIMGANSIDISQYRSRIGTFSTKKLTCKIGKPSLRRQPLETHTLMESFIILSYLLVLSNVTQKLLIISGVELNPGPFSLGKKCLINIYIFEEKKYCFIFKNNNSSIPNLFIIFNTVKIRWLQRK